jgi:hypothetical protein
MSAVFILMIIAVICWFLAAIPFPQTQPFQLGWLGLFFAGLSFLLR